MARHVASAAVAVAVAAGAATVVVQRADRGVGVVGRAASAPQVAAGTSEAAFQRCVDDALARLLPAGASATVAGQPNTDAGEGDAAVESALVEGVAGRGRLVPGTTRPGYVVTTRPGAGPGTCRGKAIVVRGP